MGGGAYVMDEMGGGWFGLRWKRQTCAASLVISWWPRLPFLLFCQLGEHFDLCPIDFLLFNISLFLS